MTRNTFLTVWLLGHAVVGGILAVASLPSTLDGTYLLGAVAGLLQWLILRRIVGLDPRWFVSSLLVGVLLGLPLRIVQSVAGMAFAFASQPIASFVPIPVTLTVLGAVLGTVQARVLRRHTGSTWPWIVAQALGMAVVGPLVFLATAALTSLLHPGATVLTGMWPLIPGAILAGGVGGIMYGAVTGAVMARLVIDRLQPEAA